MIKRYKEFINEHFNIKYDPDMGKYYVFGVECLISFHYNNLFIFDENDITILISKYNETYNNSSEWGGGPVNREFDDFFYKKYEKEYKKYNLKQSAKIWKPLIQLFLKTELGYYGLGFSVKSKLPGSIHMTTYKKDVNSLIENSSILHKSDLPLEPVSLVGEEYGPKEIYGFLNDEVYKAKMPLDEFIDLYQIEIKNNIKWEWKEK